MTAKEDKSETKCSVVETSNKGEPESTWTAVFFLFQVVFNHSSFKNSNVALWVWSVGPPHWSRLKCLNNYWMDCHQMWYIYGLQQMNPTDFSCSVIMTFLVLPKMSQQLLVQWVMTPSGRIIPTCVISWLLLTMITTFQFVKHLVYNQIPGKRMTFPSA